MSVLKNLSMTSGVFFVVFVLSLVSALNDDLDLSPDNDLVSIEEIQELLQNVQLIFEAKMASKVPERTVRDSRGCSCSGLKCYCCKYINMPKLKFNGNACLSVAYLPHNYGILVSLTFGEHSVFSKEISARNPPPICIGIPKLKRGGSVCIEFYNLDLSQGSLSGCSRLLGRLLYITIVKVDLACFRINFRGAIPQRREVDVRNLDEFQTPVEGPEPIDLGEYLMEEIKTTGEKNN